MAQLQQLIFPIAVLVIFYLMLIRPQKKKEKEVKEMRDSLRVGDEIVTIGGIYGKVVKVKEDMITIEVGAAKTKLDMTRWSVGSVTNKNESKSAKIEDKKEEENKEDK